MRKTITFLVMAVLLCTVKSSLADEEPNDQYYSKQWGLKAVHAPAVWEITTGSSNVYAVVMDTGIETGHEDLKDNLDAKYSRNFSVKTSETFFNIDSINSRDYADTHGHGTHVAGIIAARGNNGVGIAGMSWNSKIITVKVSDTNGSVNVFRRGEILSSALEYVRDILSANPEMKIVINMSLGWQEKVHPSRASSSEYRLWSVLHELDQTKRALLFISAGNDGVNISSPENGEYYYPVSYTGISNMIVVANAQNDDGYSRLLGGKDRGSNWSKTSVDIAAPGTSIFSTYSQKYHDETQEITTSNGNNYIHLTGTSQASPYAAGTAVLLWSKYPGKTAAEIKQAILKGANAYYASDYTRFGFLDAKGAFDFMAGIDVKPGIPIDDIRFPDDELRKYVLKNIDSDHDSRLSETEISSTLKINITGLPVSDLTGLKHFTSLEELYCSGTKISSKVTGINADETLPDTLRILNISNCSDVSDLDVTGCTNLRKIDCSGNNLSFLDLRGLDMLNEIHCERNKLTALELPYYYGGTISFGEQEWPAVSLEKSGEEAYTFDISMYVQSDLLSNVSGLQAGITKSSTSDYVAYAGYNVKLDTSTGIVTISKSAASDKFPVPQSIKYDYNTGSTHTLTVVLNVQGVSGDDNQEEEYPLIDGNTFQDKNLLSYVKRFDTDSDGRFSPEEIQNVKSLSLPPMEITSLKGLEIFTSLVSLDCHNNNITDMNSLISVMPSLRSLNCDGNRLTSLRVNNHPALKSIVCQMDTLSDIDLSGCKMLESFSAGSSKNLKRLNIRGTAITRLSYFSGLEELDAENCTHITNLQLDSCQLSRLNVKGCTSLKTLICGYNKLTSLDVTSCSALERIYCAQNSLQFLGVKGLKSLAYIDCSKNSLQNLELSGCDSLASLNCSSNALSSFDVSPCAAIINLDISDNAIEDFSAPDMASLRILKCGSNKITTLDLHGCQSLTGLGFAANPLRSVDISNCTSLDSFAFMGDHYGSKGTLEYLNASGCTSIYAINCNDNVITSINVTGCSSMNTLNCQDNMIASINISGCDSLEYIHCQNNPLRSLIVMNAPSLISLRCDNTSLDVLDVSGCSVLEMIYCGNSLINTLNLSGCSSLKELYCESNDLHTVDLSHCVSLQRFNARFNHLPYVELPRWFDANLHGQTIPGYSLAETGDSVWPYKFDFRQCVPEDKISNIVSHDTFVGTSQKRVQGYDGSTAIYTSYKDGVAYFSSMPTRIYYCYNADYRHYNSNSSLMDVSIILSEVHVTPSPQEPSENSSGEETPRDSTPGGPPTDGNSGSNAIPDGITGNIRSILGVDENVPVQNLTMDNSNIGTDRKDNTIRYVDGLRVLALLPEIQVYADGVYIIPVSFDTPAHLGEYLTWHPFYDDVNSSTFSSSRNEACVFLNEDGSELTMPLIREIDYLKVAAYLEAGKVYTPAISTETSSGNTENMGTSSGGGCESFTTLWALFAVFIIAGKKNA